MNQPNPNPQNRWKSPWQGPRGVLLWFLLLGVASFFIILFGSLIWEWAPGTGFGGTIALAVIAAVVIAVVGFLATVGVRSLWCWRRFRWVLFGCACLVTLFALAHAVENWRGHRAWKNYQKSAAAKGERFDLASVIPPAIPDEENFAMAPIFEDVRNEMNPEWRRAQSGLDGVPDGTNRFALRVHGATGQSRDLSWGSWMKAEKIDLAAWQTYYRDATVDLRGKAPFQVDATLASRYGLRPPDPASQSATDDLVHEFPVAPQPQSPPADVLLALSKFDLVLEELRAASGRPHSRFPVQYDEGFNALLPHLAKLKEGSQFLTLRAVAALADGRTAEAFEDVRLSFRLAEAVQTEPFLISHLVRIAQMHISLQPIWEGLADRRWNEVQLAAMQAELERINFMADYHLAMRGERAYSIWSVDYLRRTRDVSLFDHWNTSQPVQAGRRLQRLLFRLAVPRGWFEQNKVSMARMHIDLFLPAADLEARVVSPAALRRLDEAMEEKLKRRTPFNFFAGLLLPSLSRAAEKFARIEAAVDLATVACALERYQLAHGEYPKALDELVPRFIAKLPHDIINGQPLKYQRTGDGRFLLYSVGWNEIDDDGEVELTKTGRADWNEGDWVWRYRED
jgi:hypothetical protein